MPYNPGVQNISGQLMGQGISSFGDSISAGIKEYAENQKKDKSARGVIAGIIQSNPGLVSKADDKTVKLLDRFKEGNTGLKDNMFLAGWAATAQKQQEEAEISQLRSFQIMAAQRAAAQDTMLDQMSRGVGRGVYAPQMQSNPYLQLAANLRGATGQAPSPESVLAAQTREDAITAKRSGSDKNKPEEITLPSGAKVAFSPSTGGFSVLPQTPEALGKAEAAKAEAEVNAKTASALLTEITDSAENARHTIGTVDRVLELYDKGVQSGFAQPTLTQAKAALNRLGVPVENLANQQQFEKELNNLVLERGRELMKGQGQVSNYERQQVINSSSNPSFTPEANRKILSVMKNIAQRSVKLDEIRSQLEDEGKSNLEIARSIRKARDTIPIGIEVLQEIGTDKQNAKDNKPAKGAPASQVTLPPNWIIRS